MHKSFTVKNFYLLCFFLIGNISCSGYEEVNTKSSIVEYSCSIISFEAASLHQARSITLATEDGGVHHLKVDIDLGKFTPSHIRQHMVLGELVDVSYTVKGGEKWLKSIQDSKSR